MVHRDGIAEQLLEPVGVAHFRLPEVGVDGVVVVGDAEAAVGGVVGVEEVVHLPVDTAGGCTQRAREGEQSVCGHLLVDAHLLLGVHDVELRVARAEPHGVFSGVADAVAAGLALLRRDDDHAAHGARTVDRGGGTVLEDLEALDVVGVQSGDGRGDQRGRITRGEVVGIDFGDVFHDDSVDHPQRLRRTVDGRGTAHTDLRCRTERTRDVLDAHAGGAAFERPAHVGHAVELRLGGVDLRGGTREEAFVLLGHTCHDDLRELVVVVGEAHLHAVLGREGLRDHADVTDYDFLSCRHVQRELSVDVGDGSRRGTLYHDGCADDGFTIVLRKYSTIDLCLTERRAD